MGLSSAGVATGRPPRFDRRLPVERVVTSEIGIDDVVEKGFDRLIDPAGGESKVLVTATAV